MRNIPDGTLDAFVKAWNERDDTARRQLLDSAWAEDGEFSDAAGTVTGREALSARIGETLQAIPQRALEHRGWLEGLGGRTGFSWRLRAPGSRPTTGYAVAEVDDDGRLTRVASYVDTDSVGAAEPSTLAKLRAWLVANPVAAGGLLVLLFYVLLRFQAERFYNNFGVTPEDAGFGSADLVVRQSMRLLLDFAEVGLVWAVSFLVVMSPGVFLMGVRTQTGLPQFSGEVAAVFFASFVPGALLLLAYATGSVPLGAVGLAAFGLLLGVPRWRHPQASAARQRARQDTTRWGVVVVLLGGLLYATWMFVPLGLSQADSDAQHVKEGGLVSSGDYPWRARAVQAEWKVDDPPYALPPCKDLAYLGGTENRAILYDSGSDRTLRLDARDVQLTFPPGEKCPEDTRSDTPRSGFGVELASQRISAEPGRRFRAVYVVTRPALVRVSIWNDRGVVEQDVDSAAMGVNGIDLEVAKAGEYEMRLVADAGGGVRRGDRTRVVVR